MDFLIEILKMLDCCNELEIQNKGVELAANFNDIGVFILPMHPLYNKNVWENCAKIIEKRSDQELAPYVIKLLEWLQDLNWPGTFIIIERLKRIDGEILINPYIATLCKAKNYSEDDQEWLDHLTILIENKELAKKLDEDLYRRLKKRYTNFWC